MERADILGREAGAGKRLLARGEMTRLRHVGEGFANAEIRALAIADRRHELGGVLLLRPRAAGDKEPAGAVADHHAVEEPDRLRDHPRIDVVVDGHGLPQLLDRFGVQHRVAALRHRQLAEHAIVEPVQMLIALR